MRIATAIAVVAVACVVAVGVMTVLWYLPVPRTWWSFTMFVAACLFPVIVAVIVGVRLQKARR